jgi:hypothetical protein
MLRRISWISNPAFRSFSNIMSAPRSLSTAITQAIGIVHLAEWAELVALVDAERHEQREILPILVGRGAKQLRDHFKRRLAVDLDHCRLQNAQC